MLCDHGKRQSTTGSEFPFDSHSAWPASRDKVFKNSVDDLFIKRGNVPVRSQVKFQGLGLDTFFVGHVLDANLSKIGLASDRAEGGKVG